MWSIFSCAFQPSVCLLWRNVYSGFMPIFKLFVCFFFNVELYELYIYIWDIYPLWAIVLKVKILVTQLCLTFCNPMDCIPLGSSIHGIFQARVLEWVAISFSRGSSQPRDWTWVSCIAGRFFTVWATREALYLLMSCIICKYTEKAFNKTQYLWENFLKSGHRGNILLSLPSYPFAKSFYHS